MLNHPRFVLFCFVESLEFMMYMKSLMDCGNESPVVKIKICKRFMQKAFHVFNKNLASTIKKNLDWIILK